MRVPIASFLVLCAACGLTQTSGPDPRRPRDQRPACTESFDAPKRDAIGALAGFISIIIGGVVLEAGGDETAGIALLGGGGVVMAASYVSGGIGYFRVKRCREAVAEFERARDR